MPSLIQRLLASPTACGFTEIAEPDCHPGVLAITADIRLYSGILNACGSARMRTEWARSLTRAIEICRGKPTPIVIYDGNLPDVEWGSAFDRLTLVSNHSRILLASSSIDEDLWRTVILRHGYDVVERSASSDELRRVLRFAWLSLE
jgi:DNA-binding response OmpR family regulator